MKVSILVKLTLFCAFLLFVRAIKTNHYSFFFLFWNLFLAWVPYWLIKHYYKIRSKSGQFILIAITLLFLPNAPYLITDLFHLKKNLIAPLWFDLILILSFSVLGLILFILATESVLNIIATYIRSTKGFILFKFLVLLSNGYGIYLGRYLRLNSWDIISNPGDLLICIYNSIFSSSNYRETLGITFTFTIFLYLVFEIYESLKKRVGGLQNELH